MPLPDGFCTKMALHCSFEHFEGDADSGFIQEAARVLRPGGRLCILPLYLAPRYTILTDLQALSSVADFPREDAVVAWSKGWRNRFGRQYDVPHLNRRVRDFAQGFKLVIHEVTNAKEIHPSCYLRFCLMLERLG